MQILVRLDIPGPASTLDRARSAYRQSTPAATTHARLGLRVVREL